MRFQENHCAAVGIAEGVESLGTERKEPGGTHLPSYSVRSKGTHRLWVPSAEWPLLLVSSTCTVSVFILLSAGLPFSPFAPAVSSLNCLRMLPTLTLSCAFPFSPSLLHPFSWPFYFLLSVLFSVWRESCPQNFLSLCFGGNDQPQEANSSYQLKTSRLIFPPKDQNTKGCWPHQWISRNVC